MARGTRRTAFLLTTTAFAYLAGCDDTDTVTEFGPGAEQFRLEQVSTGLLVSCGVAAAGSPAFCWGNNQTGALGIGTAAGPSDIRAVPTLVVGGLSFRSVSTGGEHTCGITDAGQAFCWGANEHGELGTTAQLQTCDVLIGAIRTIPCSPSPVAVAGGRTFSGITTSTDHTCAVTTTGQGFCWGENSLGQLGTTAALETCTVAGVAIPCAREPVPVAGGLSFASINTGALSNHTCGVTTAGQAFCWGVAGSGQLGTTATLDTCTTFGVSVSCAQTPVPVAGGRTFASVSAGGTFSCGVTTGNQAFCWGRNESGQLGNTTVTTCPIPGTNFACATTPVAVEGGLSFAVVEAGSAHTCGVTTGSQAFCWGSNLNGAVGSTAAPATCVIRGVTQDFEFPCFRTPTAVTGGGSFESIDTGDEHTCVIATSQQAFCWGINEDGQLGDGTTTNRPTPVPVARPVPTI